jgi:hypothetical protein
MIEKTLYSVLQKLLASEKENSSVISKTRVNSLLSRFPD